MITTRPAVYCVARTRIAKRRTEDCLRVDDMVRSPACVAHALLRSDQDLIADHRAVRVAVAAMRRSRAARIFVAMVQNDPHDADLAVLRRDHRKLRGILAQIDAELRRRETEHQKAAWAIRAARRQK